MAILDKKAAASHSIVYLVLPVSPFVKRSLKGRWVKSFARRDLIV